MKGPIRIHFILLIWISTKTIESENTHLFTYFEPNDSKHKYCFTPSWLGADFVGTEFVRGRVC